MYTFNIVLTQRCNATCSHCYLGKLKQRKTLSYEKIKKIINNLPDNTKKVVLTGGEILLVQELLFKTINLIKKRNNNIEIELETNGKIIYDSEDPQRLLIELKNIGADKIRLSDDIFHEDGGIDLKKVLNIKNYESEQTPYIRFLHLDKVVPIGNALQIEETYIEKKPCMNNQNSIKNPYIFLDIDGYAYICTWKCIPSIGNMINEEFKIIEQRLNDGFFKLVLEGEIQEAINRFYNIDCKKLIKELGECGTCNYIFKNIKK